MESPEKEELEAVFQDFSSDAYRDREIVENSHIHTTHSDGRSSIQEIAFEAAALGIERIGLTDHWDPTDVTPGNYDNEGYVNKPFNESYGVRSAFIEDYIAGHQEENPTEDEFFDLEIAEGAELEYYFGKEDELKAAIEETDFDFINLSVHRDRHGQDYRAMRPETEKEALQIIGSYFRDLRRAFELGDEVDSIKVVSHLGGIETNDYLQDFFGNTGFYSDVLREEYEQVVEEASGKDVLPELNGKILLRHGETEWFKTLSESDIDYAVGTDTHRVGVKRDEKGRPKYDWTSETQARINMLETKIPELGRPPEPVLQDLEIPEVNLYLPLLRLVTLDEEPKTKLP